MRTMILSLYSAADDFPGWLKWHGASQHVGCGKPSPRVPVKPRTLSQDMAKDNLEWAWASAPRLWPPATGQ